MKKMFKLIVVIAIITTSCSKEDMQNSSIKSRPVDINNVRLVHLDGTSKADYTMLEFSNIEAYESTIEMLRKSFKSHELDFLQKYSDLDEEALNKKEIEIGFIDVQPLIDFEKVLNFNNSMRKSFATEEAKWLNNEELDDKTNPSNVFVFNKFEMTVLNSLGEVKIGDSLLKLTKDGFILITDGNVKTLERIDNGDLTALKDSNLITNVTEASSKGDCSGWKDRDYQHPYASNKRVNMEVHFHSYPWKGVSEAEITSYKKSGSSWSKYRMQMQVADQSYFRNNDCQSSVSGWSGWDSENSKSVDAHYTSWNAFPQYRAENGKSVIGYFKYAGISTSRVLAW
jgi:hypothetical protein